MSKPVPTGPLKTFLRGGQVTLHMVRMFGQVMRFIAYVMLCVVLAIIWSGVMLNTTPQTRHYAMKRYEAWAYREIGVKGETKLNMLTERGDHQPFPIDVILSHPFVAAEEKAFRTQLIHWSQIGGMAGGTGFFLITSLFLARGGALTRTQIKRGADMATAGELTAQIIAHNRSVARRRKEWRGRPNYTLAGVPYPIGSEVQHTSISGTIGSGKTQVILSLLEQIRAAGDRAVVFDLTGGYIAPFYREGRDIILNPLDARSPAWSVFHEARSKAGFDAIAAAMIPRGQKADPVWADSARMVFSTAAQLLVGDGHATNRNLVETLLNADLTALAPFFSGTPAATIVSPETPKMTNSVRMMLSTYLDCLRLLPDKGAPFSITDWITNEAEDRTIFLSSRADMHETLKPLLTVWMDTAVRALMSTPRDPTRRIWFLIDELPALQQLPSIMDGLARGRQFGAAFVLGVQAQSQLREIYGADGAQSVSSVCRTKLILAASDADTARWYADFLGRQERSKSNENVSFGANSIRDGVMVARQDKIEHLVIPEEILNLRSLEGYLKMPEGFPVAKVTVPLTLRPEQTPSYIPRADPSLLITRSGWAADLREEAFGHPAGPSKRRRPADEDQRDMFDETSPPAPGPADDMFRDKTAASRPKPQPAEKGSAAGKDVATEKSAPQGRQAGQGQSFPDWDMEP